MTVSSTPHRPHFSKWRPSAFLQLSFLLHLAAAVMILAGPLTALWGACVLIANHAVITLAGLWPRSRLLGANITRLPSWSAARREIALTIDDGPDPDVTPQVLDLLDRHRAKATFFCIGARAARHPDLCRAIVERGHTIENHTQHHRHTFSLLGTRGMQREISAAQATLAGVAGVAPRFFRAPAGLRNPFLDLALAREGLRLASWTRRGFDTRTGNPQQVLKRLRKSLHPGAILLLHDGNAARTEQGNAVVLEVLPTLLDDIAKAGLRPVTLTAAHQPDQS